MNTKTTRKPILLVDMDGVMADYYGGFLIEWKLRYPDRIAIPQEDLKTMYLEDSYPKEYEKDIREITTAKGFFRLLPRIKDAAKTLNEILDEGVFDPFICSTPDTHTENHCCPSEKFKWVEEVLGERWLKRIILAHDKTLVVGDYLIDDKPDITGIEEKPWWTHVVFDQAYNRHKNGYRLKNWDDWKNLKPQLLQHFNMTRF